MMRTVTPLETSWEDLNQSCQVLLLGLRTAQFQEATNDVSVSDSPKIVQGSNVVMQV